MPIPDYQDCMLPLLELLADGQDHRLRDLTKAVADRFGLSEQERTEMLPSGQQTVISNRVAWAKTQGRSIKNCLLSYSLWQDGKNAEKTQEFLYSSEGGHEEGGNGDVSERG